MLVERGKKSSLYYITSKIEKAPFLVSSKIIILRFIQTAYHTYVYIKQIALDSGVQFFFVVDPEHNLLEKYLKAPVLLF